MAVINSTDIPGFSLTDTLASLPGISDVVNIVKAIGILIALYILFLIIRGFSQISLAKNMKKVLTNVEEINSKMDNLGNSNKKKK